MSIFIRLINIRSLNLTSQYFQYSCVFHMFPVIKFHRPRLIAIETGPTKYYVLVYEPLGQLQPSWNNSRNDIHTSHPNSVTTLHIIIASCSTLLPGLYGGRTSQLHAHLYWQSRLYCRPLFYARASFIVLNKYAKLNRMARAICGELLTMMTICCSSARYRSINNRETHILLSACGQILQCKTVHPTVNWGAAGIDFAYSERDIHIYSNIRRVCAGYLIGWDNGPSFSVWQVILDVWRNWWVELTRHCQ